MDDLSPLDENLVPLSYELQLSVDADLTGFEGLLLLRAQLAAPARVLELHAADLKVSSARLRTAADDRELAVRHDPGDVLRLTAADELPAGKVAVELRYRGVVSDSLFGLYRSDYAPAGGGTRSMWLTQCSPVYARRILPCRDEPGAKADLTLRLTLPRSWHCVANGPLLTRTELPGGGVRLDFGVVPRLSPNTFFFAFGDLAELGSRVVSGIPVTVHGRSDADRDAGFVLDVAGYAIGWCERYFGIPYPYGKLDIVGIPDFGRSGMENCASIALLDAVLSASWSTSSPRELMWAIGTVCHEISHMWFGNLVAVEWWSSLWLSEAFATFLEWTMTREGYPQVPVWEVYGLARAEVMLVDSSPTTRPVEIPARSLDDIQAMFDVITFDKGFAVVLMLEQLVGRDRFAAAVSGLLRANAGGTISSADLWAALDDARPGTARVAGDWVHRTGFPVVEVDAPDGPVVVRQRPSAGEREAVFSARTAAGLVVPTPVGGAPTELPGVRLDDAAWVLGNPTGFGYYHVAYQGSVRAALARLDWSAVEPAGAFAALEDLWMQVLSLDLDPVACWDVVAALAVRNAGSDEVGLWRRTVRVLADIGRLAGAAGHQDVSAAQAAVLREVTAARGPASPPEPVRTAMAMTGDPDALAAADRDLRELLAGGTLEPDEAIAALRVAVGRGGAEELDLVGGIVRTSADPQQVRRAAMALPGALDPAMFERGFRAGIRDVRAHDAPFLLRAALTNPVNYGRAWTLLAADWARILDRIGSPGMARALEGLRTIPDRSLSERIQRELSDPDRLPPSPVVARHLEAMRTFVRVAERTAPSLRELRHRAAMNPSAPELS